MQPKSSNPKNQHYVPQFLLRNFAQEPKQQVWVYDKLKGRAFQTSIRNVAAENAFYDIKLPDGVFTAEKLLGELEADAAGFIRKVLSEQNVLCLNEAERKMLALFVSVQMLRIPQQIDFLCQMNDLVRGKWGEFDGMPSVADQRHTAREIMITSVPMAVDFVPELLTKRWLLLKAHPEQEFMISDNPVAMTNSIRDPLRGTIGLAVKGVEIHLPISSTVTLSIFCKSHEEAWYHAKRELDGIRGGVATSQKALEARAKVFDDLVQGMEKGSPVPLLKITTDFQNQLQIANSTRFIFSNMGDFSLVRESIAKNPALKTGPRLPGT